MISSNLPQAAHYGWGLRDKGWGIDERKEREYRQKLLRKRIRDVSVYVYAYIPYVKWKEEVNLFKSNVG